MNSEPRKTKLSTHVFYLCLIVVLTGYASGLAGSNDEPQREGFLRRILSWAGVAKMFFGPAPPIPVDTDEESEPKQLYQSLPTELANLPVEREIGDNGEPVLDHASGW